MIENMTTEEIELRKKELKELNKELRKRKVKTFFKETPGKVVEWTKTHSKEAAGLATAGLVASKKLVKGYAAWKDQKHRDLDVYDYSLHRWCHLKRKMRPDEEREYKLRLRKGEKVYDILNTMRLLKY